MRQLSLSHWEGEPTPPRGHALGGSGFFAGGWNHRSQKFTVSQLQTESAAWVRNAQVRERRVGVFAAREHICIVRPVWKGAYTRGAAV